MVVTMMKLGKSDLIRQLRVNKGNITKTASEYGVSRQTIYSWLKKYEQGAIPGLIEDKRRGKKKKDEEEISKKKREKEKKQVNKAISKYMLTQQREAIVQFLCTFLKMEYFYQRGYVTYLAFSVFATHGYTFPKDVDEQNREWYIKDPYMSNLFYRFLHCTYKPTIHDFDIDNKTHISTISKLIKRVFKLPLPSTIIKYLVLEAQDQFHTINEDIALYPCWY